MVTSSWHGFNRPFPPWSPWFHHGHSQTVSPLYWEVPQACSVAYLSLSQLVDSSEMTCDVQARAFSAALWQGLATWHLSAPFLEGWQPSVLSNCTSMQNCSEWQKICRLVTLFHMFHEDSWSISPYFTNAMGCPILDKRRGFLWCGLWMTLDPWKSRENIAQILLESFLGSFSFGIAAINSILLKKWSFTMWQAWQHGSFEPPPGAKLEKNFVMLFFLGFFWFAFSSCYTCYTSRKNIGKHLGLGGFCGEAKNRRFWKEKIAWKRWKGMEKDG